MTRSTSSPHAYFVRFSLPSAWIDVANPCQVALEERRKAAREDLDSIVTHTLASWVGSVNSMSQSCYHTNGSSSDCCRKLLMAFFTNEEDIWNREEEDFVAHQYDYWMDPERQTRVFSQGTVVDSWDYWISDIVCARCSADDQIKIPLRSLHLAVEVGYGKISGLCLDSFHDPGHAQVQNY